MLAQADFSPPANVIRSFLFCANNMDIGCSLLQFGIWGKFMSNFPCVIWSRPYTPSSPIVCNSFHQLTWHPLKKLNWCLLVHLVYARLKCLLQYCRNCPRLWCAVSCCIAQKERAASVLNDGHHLHPCICLFLFTIQLFLSLSFSRMSEASAESQWSLTDCTKEPTCQDFRCCQVSLQTLFVL